jgi:hypothetical protein
VVPQDGDDLKVYKEQLMKFTDSLIVSSSADMDVLQVWEPKTLVPFEPMIDKKFFARSNTL